MKALCKVTFVLALVAQLGFVACATKTTPVQTAALSHDTIAQAQDIEANLCWGVSDAYSAPSDRTHCTSPLAAKIGLTDQVHKDINRVLAQAFQAHRTATMIASQGGKPDLAGLNAAIDDVLALLKQLQPSAGTTQLTAAVQAARVK